MVTKDFKQKLCDRFTTAELAEFLDVSTEDFCEAFEDEIELNYDELADWIGLRTGGTNEFDEDN